MTSETGLSRAERRRQIEADILTVGRAHLASHGAAAISLRAVAREMGMVSSAIYRYVDSRDELLTRLLVEGYDDLAEAVTEATTRADGADENDTGRPARRRLRVVAQTVRRWARANPERFALLYGSPVPGYEAPAERTVGPGTRVTTMLLTELSEAARSGDLPAHDVGSSASLTEDLDALRAELSLQLSDGQLVHAILWWASVIGLVGQEVFGAYGRDTFRDNDTLFDAQLGILLDTLFGV